MKYREKILLGLILAGAFFLRSYHINWDQGTHLHPDERAIVMNTLPLALPQSLSQFLSVASPLNPHFFPYGNFPLYLLKAISTFAAIFNHHLAEYNGIELVGRFISSLIDILTILLIFKMTRILFGEKAGFAAAIIYALSVFPIQASHFYAVDILLTFFTTLTLFRLLLFHTKPNILNAAFVGISFGLSLVTKISAIPLFAAIVGAISIDFVLILVKAPHKYNVWLPHVPIFLKRLIRDLLSIGFFTTLTFVIFQPYALIDSKEFISQNLLQSQMSNNAYIFPYTLQYVGKIPYFYELKNLFLWGQGPVISLLCLLGVLFFALNYKNYPKEAKSKTLIILSFLLIYFLIIGKFAVGWMRYMLPLYPLLSIFGGTFLLFLVDKYFKPIKFNFVKISLGIAILLLLLIWPISFMSIYQKTNTRVAATDWINKNIPTGSPIAIEHWDDQLPLYSSNNYNFIILTLYDQPDDKTKWAIMSQKIKAAKYIIIASNRLYIPLQKLSDCKKFKECFPLTAQYYKNLFSGKLGFKKIAEFSSYPTIPVLNLQINDQGADESFTVIDHPKVYIFKKV